MKISGAQSCGEIIVTRGNPSRGSGFQVAHFKEEARTIESHSHLDITLPTMRKAVQWVRERYPSVRLRMVRRTREGTIAGIAFQCPLTDMHRGRLKRKKPAKDHSFAGLEFPV